MCAQWSINPRDFIKTPIENIEKVRRIYAYEIFKRVVQRTPVDTGAARGNWIPSTGSPSEEITDNKDKSGNQTLQKIKSVVEQAKGDDSLFLANNLPYLPKLEYGGYPKNPKHGGKTKTRFNKNKEGRLTSITGGDSKTINGFSRQAPNGMVGVVLAQAGRLFQAAVNAVKGGNA
jgi:transposase